MPKPSEAAVHSGAPLEKPIAPPATPAVPQVPTPIKPRRFVSYQTALKYLNSRTNLEKLSPRHIDKADIKLDRMRAMLEVLDNPQHQLKFVHVAGSKGKGSIVEMVASSLTACGYTPGVYTSPHLIDIRERIRIGQAVITQGEFVRALGFAASAASKVEDAHGQASYFELVTTAAMQFFAERVVDVAILEVGLGGRLDSTNVITPEVSAIAAIHLEHTHILGDTLASIAREKAGIMKPGVTTYTFAQDPEVMEVFRETAQRVGANLIVIGEDVDFSWRFEADSKLGPHAKVCLSSESSNHAHLAVPLPGQHQAINCGLSLALLDGLRQQGFATDERPVAIGLAKTSRRGRLEEVWHTPRILIDGAHTTESIHALIRAVGAHYRYDSMVVVFGCNADKDVQGMIDKVGLGSDKIIFTQSADNQRAANPAKLKELFVERHGKMAQVEPNLKEAINIAARAVGHGDIILITGSFYLAGQAKALLLEAAAKKRAASQVEPKA